MHVTAHAIDRYLERRGWSTDDLTARVRAQDRLLAMWARRGAALPPLRQARDGSWGRQWRVGEMVLVTDPDASALITFYPSPKPKRKNRPKPKGRPKRQRRYQHHGHFDE